MENPILNLTFCSKPGYPPGKSEKSHFFTFFHEKWHFFSPWPFKVYCVQKWPFFGPKIAVFHRISMKKGSKMTPKNLSGGWFTPPNRTFSDPVPLYIKKGPPWDPPAGASLGSWQPTFIKKMTPFLTSFGTQFPGNTGTSGYKHLGPLHCATYN